MDFARRLRGFLTPARLETGFALLFIALGLALRLRQVALNLSLWLDEAMLALNIIGRNFAGLAQPLDYDQGAPLGFLWGVKALELLLGAKEYVLRLLPFLAGCLALVLIWRLARQLTLPFGTLLALGLFSFSGYVISYSAQVKQYSLDAAIALLLWLGGLRLFHKRPKPLDLWMLGLGGGLAVWCSHPSVFVLGGLGLVLIADAWLKKNFLLARNFAAAAVFWLLNFVTLYFIQYRGLAANSFLTGYWADFFMPLSAAAPGWVLANLAGQFTIPGGLDAGWPEWAAAGLFLLGLASLLWQERRWSLAFVLTLSFTLAASALGKYPFGGRMGLFALPGLLLCAGEGLETLRRWFGTRTVWGGAAALLAVGILLFNPLHMGIDQVFSPKMTENIGPTLAFLQANAHPGDEIYVYRMAIPAWRYYAPRYGLQGISVLEGSDHHLERQVYTDEVQELAGQSRVWFLFSHLTDPEYVQDRQAILSAADALGSKKREFSQPTTLINLYLYDLKP